MLKFIWEKEWKQVKEWLEENYFGWGFVIVANSVNFLTNTFCINLIKVHHTLPISNHRKLHFRNLILTILKTLTRGPFGNQLKFYYSLKNSEHYIIRKTYLTRSFRSQGPVFEVRAGFTDEETG